MPVAKGNGDLISVATMVGGGLIFGFLGLLLTDFIEIVSTSFFGSFIVLRAVGLQFGGYPSYQELSHYWHYKQYGAFPTEVYWYMIGTVVLGLVGMICQCKQHHDSKKDKENQADKAMWGNSMQQV